MIGREQIVEFLAKQMIGPLHGQGEVLGEDPLRFYSSGILYPHGVIQEVDPDEEVEEEDESYDVTGGDVLADDVDAGASQPITSVNMTKPSAFGVTFRTDGEEVQATVSAACYVASRSGGRASWTRQPLKAETVAVSVRTPEAVALNGKARIVSRWRPPVAGVRTVTVAVIKNRLGPIADEGDVGAEDCLFQVALQVRGVNGRLHETPPRPGAAGGLDERKFELQYRERRTFARGHSCAAQWEPSEDPAFASVISISHMPRREVFPTIPQSTDERACDIAFLAAGREEVQSALLEFVDNYAVWIMETEKASLTLEPRYARAAESIISDLRRACRRMRDGVELLQNQPDLFRLFCLANRVMLHQMVQSNSTEPGRVIRYDDEQSLLDSGRQWRPFQLAYLLLVLPSLADDRHDDRNIVDLIWFQTGGGKTEAYLFVSVMEMLLRRVAVGTEPMGTTVLMRYTLRLLTTQQFERVCRTVCALEIARRNNPHLLPGDHRFSAGLWVGRDNTPNTFRKVDEILASDSFDGAFGMRRCPWCGEVFSRESFSHTNTTFVVRCLNNECDFHDGLPVDTVDESLYNNPPTLLLGTVDKFAQMAWEPRVRNFFGEIGRPPSLVVQDELHLLAGALGSIYGLYEAAVDALCIRDGSLPKVLASTATIRDADKQVRALYGRDVDVFPPAGISIDDSYFAKTTTDGSRLFVGILSSNKTATTSLIRTSAALAQAPLELDAVLTSEELDAYWTQVIYHSSLKEEGRTFSFLGDDIPDRIEEIASSPLRVRRITSEVIEELTSNVESWRIPQILDRLSVAYGSGSERPLAAVTCTNMLSVGVDVQRLGLMIVHGQPKSTAEYIQASSRIGRNVTHPGLIVTHFRALGSRDMSHYEMFSSFHDAFYRFVEPASVTPMSLPCRQRALHAALVSVVRQWPGSNYSTNALIERNDPVVRGAVNALTARLEARCREDDPDVGAHISELLEEWEAKARASSRLVYRRSVNGEDPLLMSFEDRVPAGTVQPWRTLLSMRSVDADIKIRIEGRV